MKLRTTAATALAASAAVLAVGAVPANAATTTLRATSLTIKSSTSTATYGHVIRLTAHLGATAHNRVVEIDNGTKVLKKGVVDSHGNLSVLFKAVRNTSFTAKFAGDSRDKAATAKVHVNTAVVISAGFVGGTVASGYHVYSNGAAQFPAIPVKVAPNKTGKTITRYLQVLENGVWTSVPSRTFPLEAGSSIEITYKGLNAGTVFRVSFAYSGDSVNSGAHTGWKYAKVVS